MKLKNVSAKILTGLFMATGIAHSEPVNSQQANIEVYAERHAQLVIRKKGGGSVTGIRNFGGESFCFQGKIASGKLLIAAIDMDYPGEKEINLIGLRRIPYTPSPDARIRAWENQCFLKGK